MKDIKAGGAARDMAMSKMVVGSMMMATAAQWVSEGRLTGAGPKNHAQRAHLEATGWQPHSLKIGDKYIQLDRADPVFTMMLMVADMMDILGNKYLPDDEKDALAGHMVFAFLDNTTNKTYLEGLSQAIELFRSDDPEKLEKFLRNTGSNFFAPAATKTLENIINYLDINSEVEDMPGIKNPKLLEELMEIKAKP
jgi:hypothetical protein